MSQGASHCAGQRLESRPAKAPRGALDPEEPVKAAAPTIPTRPVRQKKPRGSCLGRLAAVGLGAGVGLTLLALLALGAYHLWLPRYVEEKVQQKLEGASGQLGQEVSLGKVELLGPSRVKLSDLTIQRRPELAQAHPKPLAQIPSVEVELDLWATLGGQATARLVQIHQPRLHLVRTPTGASDLDPLLDKLERRLSGSAEQGEPSTGASGRQIPAVELRGGALILEDQWDASAPAATAPAGKLQALLRQARWPVERVEDLSLDLQPHKGRLDPGASLRMAGKIQRAPSHWVQMPSSFSLEALRIRDPEGQAPHWSVALDTQPRVQLLRLPGAQGLWASFQRLSGRSDGALEVKGLQAGLRGLSEPLLEAEAISATLQGRTAQSLTLTAPSLHLTTSQRGGGSLETLRALLHPEAAQHTAQQARRLASQISIKRHRRLDKKKHQTAAPPPSPSLQTWARLLEKLPATLHVERGQLTWDHQGSQRERVTLEQAELHLEHQLLRHRLEWRAQARSSLSGPGELKGEIFYQEGRLELSGQLEALRFVPLVRRLRPDTRLLRAGTASGRFTLARQAWEAPWSLEGELRLAGMEVSHRRLAPEPLEDMDLSLAGTLTWDPAAGDLKLEGGRITLEEAATLRVGFTLEGLGQGEKDSPLDLRQIRLKANLAPTQAQALFDAVPAAMRRDLEGMRMQGTLALRFDATIDPRRIADMEVDADVQAEGFQVTRFNPKTDVRKLLGEFTHEVTQPETGYEFTTSPSSPHWVSLSGVSPYVPKAIRTNEDGSFYSHGGVSWFQVRSTVERNVRERRFVRGASTVSMQVIKNLFLDHRKTVERKLQEVFLTLIMEQVVDVPKDRILEIYLNIVEWGPGVYGIRRAAQHYFGKHPSQLSLGEAVWLISILPGPRKYHSYYSRGGISDIWWARMQKLLQVMLERGHVQPEEFAAAYAQRPAFHYGGARKAEGEQAPGDAPKEVPIQKKESPGVLQRFDKEGRPKAP